MRKLLAKVSIGMLALGLPGCLAGPHQLSRTLDDWDHQLYVNSPWFDALMCVTLVPVCRAGAFVGDCLVGNAYAFWFGDAWSGSGTGFRHADPPATDGQVSSLLNEGSGFLKKD